MNRSILIVICDFLLISLLAFSSVDINKVAEEGAQATARTETATNRVEASGRGDLAAMMQLALDEERRSREQLLGELERVRSTAADRESQARALQQRLQSREQQATELQQQLQVRQQQAEHLAQQQLALEQQFSAAQTNIQKLNQELRSTSGEVSQTRERLSQTEAEARRQAEQAAALQRALAELARSNQMVLNERQQLATRLQVAEVERRHAAEQAAAMQEQVKVEREERARLAEGVKVLANKSTELVQEIRENRPLAPNTIFNQFATNRVEARISASRPGMLGTEAVRNRATTTILVTDGTNSYALCHVQDTPINIVSPGTQWESLTGVLSRKGAQVPIRSLSFNFRDPRIVWIPLSQAEVRTLGSRPFVMSPKPYKFQDAVLVGAEEGYYGECRFQIDLTTPDYVRLDNSFVRGLFGKFNPSRGDLVFSKTGELLGVMVNPDYCLVVRGFDPGATFRFGNDVRAQRTGDVLSALHAQLTQLPLKVR
ncbi:MAG TPA: hypothetical protein VEH04_08870 [Verrucomicrobiae bacterium]|nr:hypothetical protein [Verrucomicrobiae bacterium]